MRRRHASYDVVLVDLGGVVAEFRGITSLRRPSADPMTREEASRRWLASPSARAFESGRCSPEEFASGIVKEWSLPLTPNELVAEFREWTRGLLPGARELLEELGPVITLACFSNTNELHWERFRQEFRGDQLFHRRYLSHEIGYVKPDRQAFDYVISDLAVPAERILFFDDSEPNVEAGREVGLHAHRTVGVEELRQKLEELAIL